MKKIAILMLAVVLMSLPMAAMAEKLYSETSLRAALARGGDVTLGGDITLEDDENEDGKTDPLVVTKDTVLNMRHHFIESDGEVWADAADPDEDRVALIIVKNGASLTIKGKGGALLAKKNDCYGIHVREGASCTIDDGVTIVGNVSAVYVEEGTLTVNGGTFDLEQLSQYGDARYMLNCYDANYRSGKAKIIVNGGSFKDGFDPSSNAAEGPGTVFTPDNATVTKNGDTYVVKLPAVVAAGASLPQTGDASSLMLWSALAAMACAGLAIRRLRRA